MSLNHLPNELHILIAKELQPGSLLKLMASNKHFRLIGYPVLTTALEDPHYKTAALYCASANGDRQRIKAILESDATIQVARGTNSRYITVEPRHHIATLVNFVLAQGANIFLGRDPLKIYIPALSWAAWHGHVGVLKVALRRGANREWYNGHGQTALHTALGAGNRPIVQLLLEGGADVNALDERGDNPLGLEALRVGRTDLLEMLLEWGADPDKKNRRGWTPLHHAVYVSNEDAVRVLLENGAHPDGEVQGATAPLHLAVMHCQETVVTLLLDSGADQGLVDCRGRTAFELAEKSGNGTVRCLLAGLYRTRPDMVLSDGRTYTHLAAQYSEVRLLEELVKCGKDLNAKDISGKTPLHMAALKNCVVCPALLVKGGAKIDPVDQDGVTPLHLAATVLGLKVYRALLGMGSMSFTWRDGISEHTPVHIAAWALLDRAVKNGPDRFLKLKEVVELERGLLKEVLDIRRGHAGGHVR